MADFAQRAKIEADSKADPLNPPTGSTQEDVENAIALLARVRSAALDIAESVLATGLVRDEVGWARRTMKAPETTASELLGLLLAQAENLTPAQIFNVSDETIRSGLASLLTYLSIALAEILPRT